MSDTNSVYLDNGDSTRIHDEVLDAMMPYLKESYGNPASLHALGLEAEEALDEARDSLAKSINASTKEIIFTSGATESNNIALNGLRFKHPDKKHVVISAIEHASIRNIVKKWEKSDGFELTELAVDEEGLVHPDTLKEALRDDTLLVSIIHGNNEIGTVQDLEALGTVCRDKGVVFHSDMAQTLGKMPLDMKALPVDLASFNAHKLHGPKGVGALYVSKKVKVRRTFEGGPQENNVRPGTENIPAIVGFAKAVEVANRDLDTVIPEIDRLTKKLADGLLAIDYVRLNGPAVGGTDRLPGNLNVTFRYIEGEAILMSLNFDGVFVSSGSACSSRSLVPSHVLTSIGLLHEEAHGSIRYTLSRYTTDADIEKAIESSKTVVERLRAMTAFIPEQHSKRLNKDAETFYKNK